MATDTPQLFVGSLRFPEAPRWRAGHLWFSDMIAKTVCRADPGGAVEVVARLDEMPGGLGFLADGTPLVAGMRSATLYALRPGGTEVYADLHEVAGGHLDDMAVAADGTAYAGGVGVLSADTPPSGGSIIRVTPAGEVSREASGLAFPNGAAVSADGRTLLVNETLAEQVLAFDITACGALRNQRTWAKLPGLHPDGLCLDAAGAVWIGCYSENRFIRVEEGGRVTDTVGTGQRWATGVELAGPDGHTLFLLSADTDNERFFAGDSEGRIETVRVAVPGIRGTAA